jgi:hypothetical protein
MIPTTIRPVVLPLRQLIRDLPDFRGEMDLTAKYALREAWAVFSIFFRPA